MPSFFDGAARAALLDRYARLTPDARPRWGRMDAARMLCHVTAGLRMATGDLPVAPIRTPLRWKPVRALVFRLPFPKGAPTARELLATEPADWPGDVARFRAAADALAAHPPATPLAPHPLFGPLSREEWGELAWKHLDHHARQFGL